MKLTGKINGLSQDYTSGKMLLSLEINEQRDLLEGYDELASREKLSIELKPFREKRSLDANAYLWTPLDKLAKVLEITKDEIYLHFVREHGVVEIVPLKNEVIERECARWSRRGLGWMAEPLRDSKIEGYTNVLRIYGTSSYDSGEFSALLNHVVDECKAQGIQTEPQERIDALVEAYYGEKHRTEA